MLVRGRSNWRWVGLVGPSVPGPGPELFAAARDLVFYGLAVPIPPEGERPEQITLIRSGWHCAALKMKVIQYVTQHNAGNGPVFHQRSGRCSDLDSRPGSVSANRKAALSRVRRCPFTPRTSSWAWATSGRPPGSTRSTTAASGTPGEDSGGRPQLLARCRLLEL